MPVRTFFFTRKREQFARVPKGDELLLMLNAPRGNNIMLNEEYIIQSICLPPVAVAKRFLHSKGVIWEFSSLFQGGGAGKFYFGDKKFCGFYFSVSVSSRLIETHSDLIKKKIMSEMFL